MTQISAARYTGASVKRSEDPRILSGGGRYIDDVKLPGMLHAAFVRSPMAHGKLLAVDGSAARELPGVVGEVARRAAEEEFGPEIDADLEVNASFDGGEGGWSGGRHCAIAEVDGETGLVRIERYVLAEDCGALINPAIVEGQIRGGVAQGVGAVLLERSAYDEDGNFQSATFTDYLLPTACEVPRIEIEHLETVPHPGAHRVAGVRAQ